MTHTALPLTTQAVRPSRPRLALTLGDPAGIGPEIVLNVLADPALADMADITVIGNRAVLMRTHEHLRSLNRPISLADPDQFTLLDVPVDAEHLRCIQPGRGNAASGAIAFQTLNTAITHTLAGQFDGIVTAPIAKSAWAAAGHPAPGQTEVLAERAGVPRYGMLFVARSPHTGWTLRTLLATTHIPLRQVPDALTPDLMTLKLGLLVECLSQDFGLSTPRIAIAGLNPHSGEAGQLGREEIDWLIPWMQQMGDRFPQVHLDGPVPPDTLWVRPGQAWYGSPVRGAAHDAYLALYHDQGLIPVKLMAFDRAVNTTIGLPFVRTSPDHGTAFDIAGQGIADASSLRAALTLAAELADQRATVGTVG